MSIPLAIRGLEATLKELEVPIFLGDKDLAELAGLADLAYEIVSGHLYLAWPEVTVTSWEYGRDATLRGYDYYLSGVVYFLDGQVWG